MKNWRYKMASVVTTAAFLLATAQSTSAIYTRSDPGDTPQYCTLFNHMVKSGGSSIKGMLFHASAVDGVEKPVTCIYGEAYEQACLDAVANAPVIVGYTEMLRQPLRERGRYCDYFTMMRHPIDRLVSAFFYCPEDHDVQRRPKKWCGYSDDPTPIMDRLTGFLEHMWGNMAFRQLSSGLYCHSGPFCPDPKSPTAIEEGSVDIIQQIEETMATYLVIGIMEYWDLSMELFHAKIKSPVREWQKQKHANQGLESPFRKYVYSSAHMSTKIHKLLATDLLLYDYAMSLFKLQTNATLGTVWP